MKQKAEQVKHNTFNIWVFWSRVVGWLNKSVFRIFAITLLPEVYKCLLILFAIFSQLEMFPEVDLGRCCSRGKMYCLQWLIPVLLLPKPVKIKRAHNAVVIIQSNL